MLGGAIEPGEEPGTHREQNADAELDADGGGHVRPAGADDGDEQGKPGDLDDGAAGWRSWPPASDIAARPPPGTSRLTACRDGRERRDG
jgi:hypothetical protein